MTLSELKRGAWWIFFWLCYIALLVWGIVTLIKG